MGHFHLEYSIKMFRLAVVLAVVAACSAERSGQWEAYKATFNCAYMGREEVIRRGIWESNIEYIEKHNAEADQGMHTYWMGENQFTDMTNAEFRFQMNGYIMQNRTNGNVFDTILGDNPTSMDWRTKGYVTAIKNQGQCGSCWAFSTTGSLEGQHFKKESKLVSLSEQQLVDCSKAEGNKGCEGGLMDNGFKYIIKNKGIDTEESYKYTAKTGHKCKAAKGTVGAAMSSLVDVKRGDIDALESALATIGPISVAMDASHMSFQHYKTGVYSEPKCSSIRLDHGVLAVGYGSGSVEDAGDFWIIKNSWGTVWGDEGYFKIVKSTKNMCGIATQASYPVV